MNWNPGNAILLVAVLAVGAVVWSAETAQDTPSAEAREADNQRFQVSAWAHPAMGTSNRYVPAEYGAYVIDSQTGTLWLVKGDKPPKPIGNVPNQ